VKLRDLIQIRIGHSDSKVIFQIGRACPLLIVVKRLKPLIALTHNNTHSLALWVIICRYYCLMCLKI